MHQLNKQFLASLGSFYPLEIRFDGNLFDQQIKKYEGDWRFYNPSKPQFRRSGLSLFSLDGNTSGEIDLDSVREYNLQHGTNFDEMSFQTPTPIWHSLTSISEPMKCLEEHLGRSHLIKFELGGFFPPHRDLGNTFRLISFFNCSPNSLYMIVDGNAVSFESNRLYYLDTHRTHSVFSFNESNDAKILVLNVEASESARNFVLANLTEK